MKQKLILASVAALIGLSVVAILPVNLASILTGSSASKVVISDIITQPRLGWAVIYWTTDVPTTSKADYGETESYGLVSEEPWGSVKHRAYLTGIGEGTYHFPITATDPKTGKSTVSL